MRLTRRLAVTILTTAGLLLAIPAAMAALTAGTSPASPAGGKLFGVSETNSWRRSPVRAPPPQLTPHLTRLPAESQRWQLAWQGVEPNGPSGGVHSYDFSSF